MECFLALSTLTEPLTAPPPERARLISLMAVIMAAFGVGISFGVGMPLGSLTFEAWGQPKWLIGFLGAVPSLAVLLTLPFAPRIAARYGAVFLMLMGCTGAALGFIALYFFQTPEAWLLIRFLMSAALTLPWLLGETWINTLAENHNRGRIISIYAISFFAGFAIGPLLLEQIGIEGWRPFAVGAAGTFFAGLPIILASRVAPDLRHEEDTIGMRTALKLAPLGYLGGFLGGIVEMSSFSLLGNVGIASNLSQEQALWLLSLLTIGGGMMQLVVGWYADKLPRQLMLLILCIAFVVLTALLPTALGWANFSLPSQMLSFVMGGIVLGFYTVGLAVVGDDVSARDLASANAAFLIMYQAGGIVGPAITGLAMEFNVVWGYVWMLCTLMGAGAVLVAAGAKRRPLTSQASSMPS
jgi:MFS family permease